MSCSDHLYRNLSPQGSFAPVVSEAVQCRAGVDRVCPTTGRAGICGDNSADPLAPKAPQFAPKAKRVIFLFMAGAPSHLELFDYKPQLAKFDGTFLRPNFSRVTAPRSSILIRG